MLENNIKQLRIIIQDIKKELKTKNLDKYVADQRFIANHPRVGIGEVHKHKDLSDALNNVMPKFFDMTVMPYRIARYSPLFSVVHDFYWMTDGDIHEYSRIAVGKDSPDVLEKYLPNKFNDIEGKLIPGLSGNLLYNDLIPVIQTAVNLAKGKRYLESNILMLVGIESFVRVLAKSVYSIQNPAKSAKEVDEAIFSYGVSSIESLLKKIDWVRDIPITLIEAIHLYSFVPIEELKTAIDLFERHKAGTNILLELTHELNAAAENGNSDNDAYKEYWAYRSISISEKVKDILPDFNTHTVFVSLRTKLHFLERRYREDRNTVIHGKFESFDKGWKTLVYLNAFMRVFECYQTYKEIYKDE